MSDDIRFVLLTDEDKISLSLPLDFEAVAVALNSNNECVSMAGHSWKNRNVFCGSCNYRCSQGSIVWTRSDYQQQGIFYRLFFWAKEQLGIETIYISKNDPFNLLLAEKYNLSIPRNIEDLPPLDNKYETLLVANDLADRITERFQTNGIS